MSLSTTHPPGPPGPRDGPIALGAVLGSWTAPWNARGAAGAPPLDSLAASSRRPPPAPPVEREAPESNTLLVAGDASRPGFVKVPRAILLARGLSRDAKLLYAVLLAYAWQAGNCFPGAERLKEDLQCGINQVTHYLQELERAGLITVRRRGQGKTNVYTLHDLPSSPADGAAGPDAADRDGREAHTVASEPVTTSRPGASQTHRIGDPRFTPCVQTHQISESGFPKSVSLEPPNRRPEYDSEEEDSAQHQQHPTSPRVPPPTATMLAPTAGSDAAGTPGAGAAAPEDLLARLLAQGIVEGVATRLLATRGAAVVRAQLAYAAYRPWTKHPAGALVQAIKGDWEPPPGWVDAQAQAAAAARRAEEEATSAAAEEEARRRRAALPPEERVADRLAFWITGQRHKRREPDEAEIAAKRAELIAQLPPAAEARPGWSRGPGDAGGAASAAGAAARSPRRATTEAPQRPG
jgi:Helix-turn-helix domain